MTADFTNKRYILAGGPGAGKTTTLAVLRSRGFTCLPDVARTHIQSRLQKGLGPRPDPLEFARSLLQANIDQYDRAIDDGLPMFFDFSIVEALMMMKECELLTDDEIVDHLRSRPYCRTVFFFPPWEAIYTQDEERDQTFHDSVRISNSIRDGYQSLGFTLVTLPFASPEERADMILKFINLATIDEPSPIVLANRVRNLIISYLELASSYDAQRGYERDVPIANVPSEVICGWADSVDGEDLDWFTEPVFPPAEQTAIREFHAVWNEVAKASPLLPDSLCDLFESEEWERLRHAAETALAIFRIRGQVFEE